MSEHEPRVERILQTVAQAGDLYERLVLVIAPGAAMREVARRTGYPCHNVSLELSRRLLEVSVRHRPVLAPRLLSEIVMQSDSPVALLDHLEVLFDVSLRLDPLRLLQHLSRQRTLVAAWSGSLAAGCLSYAAPGHPEHRRYAAGDLPLIVSAPAPS